MHARHLNQRRAQVAPANIDDDNEEEGDDGDDGDDNNDDGDEW